MSFFAIKKSTKFWFFLIVLANYGRLEGGLGWLTVNSTKKTLYRIFLFLLMAAGRLYFQWWEYYLYSKVLTWQAMFAETGFCGCRAGKGWYGWHFHLPRRTKSRQRFPLRRPSVLTKVCRCHVRLRSLRLCLHLYSPLPWLS